jgi:electron transfer flavoprotein alpha subunit
MRPIIALVALGDPAQPDPFAAVAAAAEIAAQGGTRASAIILGRAGLEAAAEQAIREGAAEILLATHPGLGDPPLMEHLLACLEHLLRTEKAEGLLLLPAGSIGEELAARLAARLGAVPLGRCTAIACKDGRVRAKRSAYGGRAEAELVSDAALCIAAMRRPAYPPSAVPNAISREITLDILAPREALIPEVQEATGAGKRRLEGARIVVSGGRGMGGAEGFEQLARLAAVLDAATGASLPAVDAGWATVAQQVGQSGAFVTPEVYLAVGMSGTAQHLAGIGQNTRIVAINPDPEADIFQVAELGLVAPWQEVLPLLIEGLQPAEARHEPAP